MAKNVRIATFACGAVMACVAGVAVAGVAPFTMVVLPDTQVYSMNARLDPFGPGNVFTRQTQWIADNVASRNIRFVSHVGDIVDSGGIGGQWVAASAAMDRLLNVVPHSVVPGNHDYGTTNVKAAGLADYRANMGPARFDRFRFNPALPVSATNFHGGFMPDDFGGLVSDINVGNSFQLFTSGQGHLFLHIGLEWHPNWSGAGGVYMNRKVYDWAQTVIDAFPGVPTVLTTHEDLRDADPSSGNGGVTTIGAEIFNRLVRNNDQIFMMLSGHNRFGPNGIINGDGEWRRVDTNAFGNPVVRMMSNFQDWPGGGSGFLRLVTFDLDAASDNISVRTFSPTRNEYLIDFIGQTASQFSYDMEFFGGRFPAIPEPGMLGLVLLPALLLGRRR